MPRVSALHIAARDGKIQDVRRLIEGFEDPDVRDRDGWTPLHYAAWKGQVDVIQELMEWRADPNAVTKHGLTPLHLASGWGSETLQSIQALLAPKRLELDGRFELMALPPRTLEEMGFREA